MHIWGPDKAQKVIFVDEAERYFNSGWRDHPSKIGSPLDPEDLRKLNPEPLLKVGDVFRDDVIEAPKRGRGRKQ